MLQKRISLLSVGPQCLWHLTIRVCLGFRNYAPRHKLAFAIYIYIYIYIDMHVLWLNIGFVIEFKLRQFTSGKLRFLLVVRELLWVCIWSLGFVRIFRYFICNLHLFPELYKFVYSFTRKYIRERESNLNSNSNVDNFISKFARLIMNTIKAV